MFIFFMELFLHPVNSSAWRHLDTQFASGGQGGNSLFLKFVVFLWFFLIQSNFIQSQNPLFSWSVPHEFRCGETRPRKTLTELVELLLTPPWCLSRITRWAQPAVKILCATSWMNRETWMKAETFRVKSLRLLLPSVSGGTKDGQFQALANQVCISSTNLILVLSFSTISCFKLEAMWTERSIKTGFPWICGWESKAWLWIIRSLLSTTAELLNIFQKQHCGSFWRMC